MKVVASGLEWMGSGVGSIQNAIQGALDQSRISVTVVAYALTDHAPQFLDSIEDCLKRGIRVEFLVNKFEGQQQRTKKKIQSFAATYVGFSAFTFVDPNGGDLHSKLVIVDGELAVVGSANLSWNGLVKNHELAILVDDAKDVGQIKTTVDKLFRSRYSTLIMSTDEAIN